MSKLFPARFIHIMGRYLSSENIESAMKMLRSN